MLCMTALLISFSAAAGDFGNIFVDRDWMNDHLDDPSVVVIHLDSPENYRKGHIPGALYFEQSAYAAVRNGLYFEMPDAEKFAPELQNRGIDGDKKVIICSGWDTFAHAFRFYVTMEYFGLADQSRILDGGIRGWDAAGFQVTQDSVISSGTLQPPQLKQDPSMLVGKDWVRKNLDNPGVCLIDARRPEFYSGLEKGNYKRGGHIQGAENLTWTELVDENFILKDPEVLQAMYEKIIEKEKTLVLYCHVALRASVLYTVGKALGYDVYLYDGSFNEWDGLDDSYPVDGG